MNFIIPLFRNNPWLKLALAALAGFLLIAILIYLVTASMDRAVETSHDTGVAEERAESFNQTLARTQEANNAAENIKRNPAVRDAECLRHARNPEDCGGH